MDNLDDLLKVDAKCAEESALIFAQLGENAIECANAGLGVFAITRDWVSQAEKRHPAQTKFNEAAAALGISGRQLLTRLRQPAATVSEDRWIQQARGSEQATDIVIAHRTLLHLMWRSYRWGLTDLRRLRLTSAAGHLRVGAESVGLMLLFKRDTSLVRRWLNPKEDSKKFFSVLQPKLKRLLREHQLSQAYDVGSAVAQHARFASAARGMRFTDGEVEVLDQEFDPHDPVTFLLPVAYFLRTHSRMFQLLPAVFDGLSDTSEFRDALSEYIALEEKTWWVLERRYAAEIREFTIG